MTGALSDVGNVRTLNEDYLGYNENLNYRVYVVADGMGGHNAGEVASNLAVTKTLEFIETNNNGLTGKELLSSAIRNANNEIYKHSVSSNELNGMGTTITACIVTKDTLITANVGDSSCFVLSESDLLKVTRDHSLVQELIDEGSITEEQARKHPNRNIITRALGTSPEVQVDLYEMPLKGIQKIVLCSDGLTNEVSKEEMLSCILESDSNLNACRGLIDLAKLRGGKDNISVMIFKGECKDDWDAAEQQI
jgi:protein phosphatase